MLNEAPRPPLLPHPLTGADTGTDAVAGGGRNGDGGGPAGPRNPQDDANEGTLDRHALHELASAATCGKSGGLEGFGPPCQRHPGGTDGTTCNGGSTCTVCAAKIDTVMHDSRRAGGISSSCCTWPDAGMDNNAGSGIKELPVEVAKLLQAELSAHRLQLEDLAHRLPLPMAACSVTGFWDNASDRAASGSTKEPGTGSEGLEAEQGLQSEIELIGASIGRLVQLLQPHREAQLRIQASLGHEERDVGVRVAGGRQGVGEELLVGAPQGWEMHEGLEFEPKQSV